MLLAMAGMMFHAATLESQTYDEGFHITAGYSYWEKGDYRLNPEHPPLVKMLCAVPLFVAGANFPWVEEAWKNADQVTYFGYFVYRNKLDADQLLLLARSVTILLAVVLGAVIAYYARRRYSAAAALAASFFYATDANFIAHGHYITTDVPVTLFVFLAVVSWLRALERDGWKDYALASLVLGLALGAKFSAVFLIPVHLLVALIKRRFRIEAYAATCVGALLVVGVLYLPETLKIREMERLAMKIPQNYPLADAAHQVADDFNLPNHRFLYGLWDVVSHNHEGHRSYLNGKVSTTGDWRYFPTAFAVKTPTPTLALSFPALVAGAPGVWLLYPIVYVAISMSSNLNIGLRHLLPVYPFLFISIGAMLAHRLPRRLGLGLFVLAVVLQIGELMRVQPHYLAFFNTAAGGPANGHKYLLDSNLDWGQDTKKLSRWMHENKINEVCISYFGTASLDYYEIGQIPLLALPPETDPRTLDCVAAVSANNLFDLYTRANQHAWARELTPMRTIGHSIYLFDLRKKASSTK